ncbi:hypothetical protein, partial [Klebsiella pneumoniae]|uniref:hypothetical protein n=1 Tax=Klebsiella pneumoniae TaxID=573 RepID=UPI001F4A30B3
LFFFSYFCVFFSLVYFCSFLFTWTGPPAFSFVWVVGGVRFVYGPVFIVLSGFATTALSVRFRDARQWGGAYGKTAAVRPFLLSSLRLLGFLERFYACSGRSPQPNDRRVATE